MSPVIFQFGELLPKSVYYLTPMSRLQKDIRWFQYFFYAFLLLSYPLVIITRLFEKLSGQENQPNETVLGRNRLSQLMEHGHAEGVLTDIQNQLTNGLLQLAPQPVTNAMIPQSRVLSLAATSTVQDIVDYAKKFAISGVVIHNAETASNLLGYVKVAEILRHKTVVIHAMPEIPSTSSKLVALHQLQCAEADFGVIRQNGESIGIVTHQGLASQIFRPKVISA